MFGFINGNVMVMYLYTAHITWSHGIIYHIVFFINTIDKVTFRVFSPSSE